MLQIYSSFVSLSIKSSCQQAQLVGPDAKPRPTSRGLMCSSSTADSMSDRLPERCARCSARRAALARPMGWPTADIPGGSSHLCPICVCCAVMTCIPISSSQVTSKLSLLVKLEHWTQSMHTLLRACSCCGHSYLHGEGRCAHSACKQHFSEDQGLLWLLNVFCLKIDIYCPMAPR